MNLPTVVADLVSAQNEFDSHAYANCFTDQAIVHDEGKTYQGKADIRQWIEASNQKYRAVMKPLHFAKGVLSAEVAGNFPGSPAVLKFHLTLENGLISALKVTG